MRKVYNGRCHHAGAVNYLLWGYASRLCKPYNENITIDKIILKVRVWKMVYGGKQSDEAAAFARTGFLRSPDPSLPSVQCNCQIPPTLINVSSAQIGDAAFNE